MKNSRISKASDVKRANEERAQEILEKVKMKNTNLANDNVELFLRKCESKL